ncbi:hypothetical protein PHYPO_G00016420 [Pangasianodon hypophthalmus]|uniref:Uncharacterized protein n=1 Tax=Pangasianodon hypophthalmus TaxID=310915 RepID=A0A5N5N459_PANHP|nr:hypothetical protein PHYPO_G00016420 [Pangasianodon hypophthalmus]
MEALLTCLFSQMSPDNQQDAQEATCQENRGRCTRESRLQPRGERQHDVERILKDIRRVVDHGIVGSATHRGSTGP